MKLSYTIPSSSFTCDIDIRTGLLNQTENLAQQLRPLGFNFVIITDEKIASICGNQLQHELINEGLKVCLFSFPIGEQYKSRETKAHLEDLMLENKCGIDTCLLAVGGGVVTDLAGFLASTYCRGIPYVSIPTTLLGMADASIGGKTGVNNPYGKNLIGSIYHPKKIWMDPLILKNLPLKELKNGFVEMIKHGLIAKADFFETLEQHSKELLSRNMDLLEKVIQESCQIKIDIVEKDERGNHIRHLVNFGHTVGHALEKLTNYTLSHGEAVALGILAESHLAVQSGKLSINALKRIENIFIQYEMRLHIPDYLTVQSILDAMVLDKKSLKGIPRFVLLKEIGSPFVEGPNTCFQVDENMIKNSLTWMQHDLCRH